MKSLLPILLCLFFFSARAQTALPLDTLHVLVVDEKGEALIGASIKLLRGEQLAAGRVTDFTGTAYFFSPAGNYGLEVDYTGYSTLRISGVTLGSGVRFIQIALSERNWLGRTDMYPIYCYCPPMIDPSPDNSGVTFSSVQISHMY